MKNHTVSKIKKIFQLILPAILCFSSVAARRYLITVPLGVVRSPTRAQCLMDRTPSNIDSHWRMWNITVPPDKALYIHFTRFKGFDKASCLAAAVRVLSGRRQVKKFCAAEEVNDYIEKDVQNTTIAFHSRNCFESFAFKFALVDVHVRVVSHVPIAVGEKMLFELTLLRTPVKGVKLICELSFGDGYNQIILSLPAKVHHTYKIGGLFQFQFSCTKIHWLGALNSKGSITVEANLTSNSINLKYIPVAYPYVSDSAFLNFTHDPTSPFIYHLIVAGESYRDVGSSTDPTSTSFSTSLTRIMQIHSGPGVRPFTIILENTVSWMAYYWNFTTYKLLKEFSLSTDVFVSPKTYEIHFRFKEGVPANISADLIKHDSIYSIVAKYETFCPKDCELWTIKRPSPPFVNFKQSTDDNKFRIYANASNQNSFLTGAWGPFELLPQIYDVYIAVTGHAYVNQKSELNIFVRTDVGNFHGLLYYNYDPRPDFQKFYSGSDFWVFNVKKTLFRPDHTVSVPFNSRYFLRETGPIVFKYPGRQKIVISLKNPNYNLQYTIPYQIFVRNRRACLQKARIRDGNKYGWFTSPVNLMKRISLSAQTTIATDNGERTCIQYYTLQYNWVVHKINHSYEVPDGYNWVELKNDATQTEILILPTDLPAGLYVITLVVTSFDISNKEHEEEMDFTLVEVFKPKLNFQIKGGNKRVLGINSKIVKFQTTLHYEEDNPFTMDWFCATSREDLPGDVKIAKLLKQGDCFTQQTQLYISSGHTMKFSTFALVDSEHYFIRAYASKAGFEPGYADQAIEILAQNAPEMHLSCVSNCGLYLNEHLPFVLRLECPTCQSSEWVLLHFNTTNLDKCNSQEFCTVSQELIEKLRSSFNNYLTVTGFDVAGKKASASLRFGQKTTPRSGYCDFSYIESIRGRTVVSLSCEQYVDLNIPLHYKFYLLHGENRNSLLQHGYDTLLSGFIISPIHTTNVSFLMKVCNAIDSCTTQTTSIVVKGFGTDNDVNKELHFDLVTKDVQTIAQTLAGREDMTAVPYNSIHKVAEEMTKVKIFTLDTAKQVCDIFNHITNQTHMVRSETKGLIWTKLDEIKSFAISRREEDAFDLISLVSSCVSAASHMLQSKRINRISEKDFERIISLTRVIQPIVYPGERTVSVASSGVEASFLKFNITARKLVNYFEIQPISSIHTDGIINVETHKFDGTVINFNTTTRKVEEVISVSIGNDGKPVGPLYDDEDAQYLYSNFPLPPSKLQYSSAFLNVSKVCINEDQVLKAVGIIEFTRSFDPKENIDGSIFKISLEDTSSANHIWDLKITFNSKAAPENKNTELVHLEKQFLSRTQFYDWSIPLIELPSKETNYTITIDGGLLSDFDQSIEVIELKMLIYVVNCFYWDNKQSNWNHDRCKSTSNVAPSSVRCQCDYFPVNSNMLGNKVGNSSRSPTFYASRVLVYPQKNVKKLIWVTIIKNPSLIIFFLVIISGYVYLMKWAVAKDIAVEKEGFIIDCKDNSPFESYRYLVTIYTGWRPHSGTTATVAIKLRGRLGKSKVHLLQTPDDIVLKTISAKTFLITTFERLGRLRVVYLWHDGQGKSPTWRVQRMSVRDMETDECWFINCNTCLEKGFDYAFKPARHSELDTLRSRLAIKWETNCKNRHLWCSLYAMQPWHLKEMNRAQTLSVGLLQLLLVMVATMTSFEGLKEYPCQDNPNATAWFIFTVGVRHGIFVFPLLFLIHGLFRASHKHIGSKKTAKKEEFLKEKECTKQQDSVPDKALNTAKSILKLPPKPLIERISVHECKKTPDKLLFQPIVPVPEVQYYNLKQPEHLKQKHFQAAVPILERFKNPHFGLESEEIIFEKGAREHLQFREPTPQEVNLHGITYFLTNARPQIGVQATESDIDYATQGKSLSGGDITRQHDIKEKKSSYTQLEASLPSDKVPRSAFASTSFHESPSDSAEENLEIKQIYQSSIFPSAGREDGYSPLQEKDPVYREHADREVSKPFLPWYFIFITWWIWGCLSAIALVVSLLYGWKFRTVKTLKWFVAAFIAFIEAAVFFETLLVALATLIMCFTSPKQDFFDWLPPINRPILPRYISHMVTERRRQKEERKTNPAYRQPGIHKAPSTWS